MKKTLIAALLIVCVAASAFAVDLSWSGGFYYYMGIPFDGSGISESGYDTDSEGDGVFGGGLSLDVTGDNFSIALYGDEDDILSYSAVEAVLSVDLTGSLAEIDVELPADVDLQIGNSSYSASYYYYDPNGNGDFYECTQGDTAVGASIGLDAVTLEVGADVVNSDVVVGLSVAAIDGVDLGVSYDTATASVSTTGAVDLASMTDSGFDTLELSYGVDMDTADTTATTLGVCLDTSIEGIDAALWYEYNNSDAGEHEVYGSFGYSATDSLYPYASIGCTDLSDIANTVGYDLGATLSLADLSYTADLSGDLTAAPELSLGVEFYF